MRILGIETPLRVFELDLLFTESQLKARNKPEYETMAQQIAEKRAAIKEIRREYEELEDFETIAFAAKSDADSNRDSTLIRMGRLMDSIDPGLRQRIMILAPSKIASMALDKETVAIDDILARIKTLDENHPVRTSWESTLKEQNEHFKNVSGQLTEVHSKWVDIRSSVMNLKFALDTQRNQIYGELVKLEGKKMAGSFFRRGSIQTPKIPQSPEND